MACRPSKQWWQTGKDVENIDLYTKVESNMKDEMGYCYIRDPKEIEQKPEMFTKLIQNL